MLNRFQEELGSLDRFEELGAGSNPHLHGTLETMLVFIVPNNDNQIKKTEIRRSLKTRAPPDNIA